MLTYIQIHHVYRKMLLYAFIKQYNISLRRAQRKKTGTKRKFKNRSLNIVLSKGSIFSKNADFLRKNAGISKINGVLVLKAICSETACLFVLM